MLKIKKPIWVCFSDKKNTKQVMMAERILETKTAQQLMAHWLAQRIVPVSIPLAWKMKNNMKLIKVATAAAEAPDLMDWVNITFFRRLLLFGCSVCNKG
jgi:hypothetical protein